MNFRAVQRGGVVHIRNAKDSFAKTLGVTLDRIPKVISRKVNDLLSEYEWTPREPEGVPTPYLSTLFQWLTTVIDSLALDQKYKDKAYEGATAHINDFYMVGYPSSQGTASHMLNGWGSPKLGCFDFEGEPTIDQPERVRERVGRYPVPQGPVYGRGVR